MKVDEGRLRYDDEGNRIEDKPRPKPKPKPAPAPSPKTTRDDALGPRYYDERYNQGSGLGGLLSAIVCGGLIWWGIAQVLPPAPAPDPAAYGARFDAIATWREEAVAIIDETTTAWDGTAARYAAGRPQGVETPPCPFIRGYEAVARADFAAAREALSAEILEARKELALHDLERNAPNAAAETRTDLEALESLHPVCLRWYTAEATRREAVRWRFQCPDESDPAPPPGQDDDPLFNPLNPLSPLNPLNPLNF